MELIFTRRAQSFFDDLILEPTRAVSVLNMQMSALLDHLATRGRTDPTSSTASISPPSVTLTTLGPRAVTELATARSMSLTTLSTMTTTPAPLTITVTLSRNDEASAATKTFPDLPLTLLPPTTAAAGATSNAMSSVRTTLASSSAATSSAVTAPTVTVIHVTTETITALTTTRPTTTGETPRPTMSILTLGSGGEHKAFNPLSPIFEL
ncbi:hypothetical protein B9Z65_4753 [Elsinoe australis]|uniref:Uncharacterized protein n=1 Tax=Elsinoe australis TaxID=40998 RepID=A0A2P8A5Y1_9PEZI|nr:hypothetical protein B9Z65_4753 [Elsinoe australis]